MTARLISAAKTDVGLKRTHNEDNFIMIPNAGLWVLCDGMGGHASGQVASSLCVTNVAQFICDISKKPGFTFPYQPNPQLSYEANLLMNAIKYANERVFIESCKDRAKEGMGTTITAILSTPHSFILAHVGDSRIYRMRNHQIVQVSKDHSLLNHLIDKGELKPEDAKNFANKNVILRAIGLKDYVDVDVKEVPRLPGDVYLMCSDGLSDLVSSELMCSTVYSSPTLNDACNQLIGYALQAGGKDNVTVVTVAVEQSDDDPNFVPIPICQRPQPSPISGMQPKAMQGQPSSQSNPAARSSGPNMAAPMGQQSGSSPMMNGLRMQSGSPMQAPSHGPELEIDPTKRIHSIREPRKAKPQEDAFTPPPVIQRKSMAAMPAPPGMVVFKAPVLDEPPAPAQAAPAPVPVMVKLNPQEQPAPVSETEITKIAPRPAPAAEMDLQKLSLSSQPPAQLILKQVKPANPEEQEPLPSAELLITAPPTAADDDVSEDALTQNNAILDDLLVQKSPAPKIPPSPVAAAAPKPAAAPFMPKLIPTPGNNAAPPKAPSFVPTAAAASAMSSAASFNQVPTMKSPAAPQAPAADSTESMLESLKTAHSLPPVIKTPAEPQPSKGYSLPDVEVKPRYQPELEKDFFDEDDEDSIEIAGYPDEDEATTRFDRSALLNMFRK